MKPRSNITEHKRDITSELEKKKATLERLKRERLLADGFFDYFKRKELSNQIHSLESEIVTLTAEAENQNILLKATHTVKQAVSNAFGFKTEEQKLAEKVERQRRADEVSKKNHGLKSNVGWV